jgi:hypothetical protein
MVKSGMKAAMIIATPKKMPRLTSEAPARMWNAFALGVSVPSPVPGLVWVRSRSCRKMLSTMMTVESTMIPKSMAPTDKRFAESPRATRIMKANRSATGIVADTTTALRRSPRKSHWSRKISATPKIRLWKTVRVVTSIRSRRS